MMRQFTSPGERYDVTAAARAVRSGCYYLRYRGRSGSLNLGIIGFPKCGTTTLHQALLRRRELVGVSYEIQGPDFFRSHTGLQTIIKNPNLVYEPWWLYTIDRTAGPAKYIVCLRAPQSMLHSFYWYRIAELKSGASWIRGRLSRPIPSESEVMLGRAELLGASRGRVDYVKWIRHLTNFIPSKRIHCVILEQLSSDPGSVEAALDEFAGIRSGLAENISRANSNADKPSGHYELVGGSVDRDGFFGRVRKETNALLADLWGIRNEYWG